MAKTLPQLTFENVGSNVAIAADGEFAYVRMGVGPAAVQAAQPSKTGKTRIVAGSGGFIGIPGHEQLRLSLNLTTK